MFARYLFTLCIIALFVLSTEVRADEQREDEVEDRNPAVRIVAKLIARLFTSAAASCLVEAAEECKQHWKNPNAALACGRNFLSRNHGRCAFD